MTKRRADSSGEPGGAPSASREGPSVGALVASARRCVESGDTLVYAGDIGRAKIAYGEAIDAFLEARLLGDAVLVCDRLIRIAPDVVRTRYTLVFLLVGLRRWEDASRALQGYADAVERTGTTSYAVPRLTLLAYATEDPRLRGRIMRLLEDYGADSAATRLVAEKTAVPDDAESSRRLQRWERLLALALQE